MSYGEVALPSTGGIMLLGVTGLFYGWVVALIAVMLLMTLFGLWRLRQGEKEIKKI